MMKFDSNMHFDMSSVNGIKIYQEGVDYVSHVSFISRNHEQTAVKVVK